MDIGTFQINDPLLMDGRAGGRNESIAWRYDSLRIAILFFNKKRE